MLRLAKEFHNLTLLTVTREHLIDMELVAQRLQELKPLLPSAAKWVHAVAQPTSFVIIGEENH